jgi:hypothetical protein
MSISERGDGVNREPAIPGVFEVVPGEGGRLVVPAMVLAGLEEAIKLSVAGGRRVPKFGIVQCELIDPRYVGPESVPRRGAREEVMFSAPVLK